MYRESVFAGTLVLAILASTIADAAIIQFDVRGVGGDGLLPANEIPAVASTGSGGEIGSNGIQFDDVTKTLSLMVGWGSVQGFTDLTSDVVAGHLHGGPINGTGGVLINFGITPTSPLSGTGSDGVFSFVTAPLTTEQETALLGGNTYLNFHTVNNGGGEIRGNLLVTAVPEPGSVVALVGLLGGGIARRRLRRKAS